MTKRKTPQTPPVTFYLGAPNERQRRIDELTKRAEALGVTRSVLLQMIADGDIDLVPKRREPAQQSA